MWFTIIITAFSLTPLLLSPASSEVFELPKLLFLYCSALMIIALLPLYQLPKIKNPFFFCLLIIVIVTFFSALGAPNKSTAFFGYYPRFFGGLLPLIAVIIIANSLIFLKQKQIYALLGAIFIAALISCVYALFQFSGLDPHLWTLPVKERVFSTLGQPNWLAAYLATITPVIIGYREVVSNQYYRQGLTLIALACAIVILLTKSVTGIFGLACGILLNFFLGRQKNKRLVLIIMLALLAGTFHFQHSLLERTTTTAQIRILLWKGAYHTYLQASPLQKIIGYGPDHFVYAFLPQRPLALNNTPEWDLLFSRAHNQFLDILINTGILGLTAYALFIVYYCKWFIKHKETSQPTASLLTGIFAGWSTLLITSFFGFWVSYNQLLFFSLPLLSYSLVEKQPILDLVSKLSRIKLFGPLLICLSGLSLIARFFVADIYYQQGRSLLNQNQAYLAEYKMKKAIHLIQLVPDYYRDLAFTQSLVAANLENPKAKQQKTQEAAYNVYQALNKAPQNSKTYRTAIITLGNLSQLEPSYETANLALIEQALTLIPTDSSLWLLKANFLNQIGRTNEAINAWQTVLNLKPDHPEASKIRYLITNSGGN